MIRGACTNEQLNDVADELKSLNDAVQSVFNIPEETQKKVERKVLTIAKLLGIEDEVDIEYRLKEIVPPRKNTILAMRTLDTRDSIFGKSWTRRCGKLTAISAGTKE